MINEELLDKLLEENKIKQTFQLDKINEELKEKWNDDKYYFDEKETMLLKMINCEYNYIVLLNDYTKLQKRKN